MNAKVVILGCGYTGRIVQRMLPYEADVIATDRRTFDANVDADLSFVPVGSLIVHSIPRLEPLISERIARQLGERAARLVYLSTTGVYGPAVTVDETTPVDPQSSEARSRIVTEQQLREFVPSCLVLRPAAIYGPGRGVHQRMLRGDYSIPGDGSNYVSRIHVEDLAAHVVAGLFSDVTGAWPVADDEPSTTTGIVSFCASLLNLPMPPVVDPSSVHHTRTANRRVNGAAIRHLLGVELKYPSYRVGIPASLV